MNSAAIRLAKIFFRINDITKQSLEEFVVPKKDDTADYTLVGQVYDREKINQCWETLKLNSAAIRLAKIFFRINDIKYFCEFPYFLSLDKSNTNERFMLLFSKNKDRI